MPADLHIHTSFSDGTNSPEEVVKLAKSAGLTAIAITDHDIVSGIGRAKTAGKAAGLVVLPGIEFTCEAKGAEIHILGYLFDEANIKLVNILKEIQKSRVERIYKTVEKLNALKIKINPEDVFSFVKDGVPARPHVARALVKLGAVSSYNEAFARYIDYKGPAYVDHYRLSPEDAINLIFEAGGISVFAHPAVSNRDNIIPRLIKAGLRGLEVFYSGHSQETTERYKNLALKYGLLMTGGSDFHGENSGRNVKLGDVLIPDELVEKLKNAK